MAASSSAAAAGSPPNVRADRAVARLVDDLRSYGKSALQHDLDELRDLFLAQVKAESRLQEKLYSEPADPVQVAFAKEFLAQAEVKVLKHKVAIFRDAGLPGEDPKAEEAVLKANVAVLEANVALLEAKIELAEHLKMDFAHLRDKLKDERAALKALRGSSPLPPPASSASALTEACLRSACEVAQRFYDSLMRPVELPGSDETRGVHMRLWKVHSILDDSEKTLVERACTRPYWEEVKKTALADESTKTVATGSPGTGKTSTTAVLLGLLLRDPSQLKVAYLVRDTEERGLLYVFTPRPGQDHKIDAFSASHLPDFLWSAAEKKTVLVIETGRVKKEPNHRWRVRVVLVCSPDPRHWGTWYKTGPDRGEHTTMHLYYSLWREPELVAAAPWIVPSGTPSAEEVRERFHLFGGVPRLVFARERGATERLLSTQRNGVEALRPSVLDRVLGGELVDLAADNSAVASSHVLGYVSESPFSFSSTRVVVVSEHAKEVVWEWGLRSFWLSPKAAKDESALGNAFEAHVRRLTHGGGMFETRLPVDHEESSAEDKAWRGRLEVDPRSGVRQVSDPVKAVVEEREDGVVFFSTSAQLPLLDFIYRRGNTYFAWQATVSDSHSCDPARLQRTAEALGVTKASGRSLKLLYAVPAFRFGEFVLDPRLPLAAMAQSDKYSISVLVLNVLPPANQGQRGSGPRAEPPWEANKRARTE